MFVETMIHEITEYLPVTAGRVHLFTEALISTSFTLSAADPCG
jgi:hypothetical protein